MGQNGVVRVGTWNLEGRWSADHLALLTAHDCDVWLLTEVRDDTKVPGFEAHLTTSRMGPRKFWAGVFARDGLRPLPDPHPASAAAVITDLAWCSSILPWRSCGTEPWGAGASGEKTVRALEQIRDALPAGGLVWGGDWNHAMRGREYVGSLAGRAAIRRIVADRHLTVTTHLAAHRIPGLYTIDHIAVPDGAQVLAVERIVAEDPEGNRLSDHDAYTTEFSLA